jgi:hypothetical protein
LIAQRSRPQRPPQVCSPVSAIAGDGIVAVVEGRVAGSAAAPGRHAATRTRRAERERSCGGTGSNVPGGCDATGETGLPFVTAESVKRSQGVP